MRLLALLEMQQQAPLGVQLLAQPEVQQLALPEWQPLTLPEVRQLAPLGVQLLALPGWQPLALPKVRQLAPLRAQLLALLEVQLRCRLGAAGCATAGSTGPLPPARAQPLAYVAPLLGPQCLARALLMVPTRNDPAQGAWRCAAARCATGECLTLPPAASALARATPCRRG